MPVGSAVPARSAPSPPGNGGSTPALFQLRILFLQRFESFGTGHIHIAILSAPTMEARFGDVVLAANRIDGVVTVGWAQNADNSFGTMSPLLHQTVP